MALLLILVIVAVVSVALSAWLLDRTRSDDGECDCTRCAEKRRAGLAEWEREYLARQEDGDAL